MVSEPLREVHVLDSPPFPLRRCPDVQNGRVTG